MSNNTFRDNRVVAKLVSDVSLKRARAVDEEGNDCIRVTGLSTGGGGEDVTAIKLVLGSKFDEAWDGETPEKASIVALLKSIVNTM